MKIPAALLNLSLLSLALLTVSLASLKAEFAPDDYPSLRLWLDATDSASLTLDEGTVTAWADKSSNEASYTAAGTPSAINGPTLNTSGINGLPSVNFAGSQGLISDTRLNFMHNGTGFTSFFVYEVNSQAANHYHPLFHTGGLTQSGVGILMRVHQLSGGDSYNFFLSRGASPQMAVSPGGTTLELGASVVQQDYSYSAGTNSTTVWQDGDALGTSTNSTVVPSSSTSSDLPSIGYHISHTPDNFTLYGQISEMLIYEGALSEAQQQQVGFYLAQKYDLSTSYIPEPAPMAFAFAALALLVASMRRRIKTRAS